MALESDLDAASICCCQNTHLNEFGVTPSICVSHSLTISFKLVCKQLSTVIHVHQQNLQLAALTAVVSFLSCKAHCVGFSFFRTFL